MAFLVTDACYGAMCITCAGCRALLSSDELQQFDRARVFLDEDFTAIDQFTVSLNHRCNTGNYYVSLYLLTIFDLLRVHAPISVHPFFNQQDP